MSTWLEDINVLELSAVRHPANRKKKLHQKSEDIMPGLWIPETIINEIVTKSGLNDAQKTAIKAALGELNKAKDGMPEDLFKGAHEALAKLLGFGASAKTVEELETAKKTAEAAQAKAVEVVKAVIGKLEADKPAITEAVTALAELAKVTPQLKRLDALPPELKAEWEALQKSREADRKALEEMQKSLAAREAAAEQREYVTKAAAELPKVPLSADKLGQLLHTMHKADAEQGKTLTELLKAVNEIVAQSEVFKELGGGGPRPADKGGVVGKIQAKAEQLVLKSDGKLTKEQAFAKVLELEPQLYTEYVAQQ